MYSFPFRFKIRKNGDSMSDYVRFVFVYPNGDEIEYIGHTGILLSQAAVGVGIAMDEFILPTCKVSIQAPSATESFGNEKIRGPNEKEIEDFSEIEAYGPKNYRYANMYMIGKEMEGASVFLNLTRITYIDRANQEYHLHAILNENFMSLRDRNNTKIDLSFSCRGGLACATCHCIFVGSKEEPSDDEVDLLQYTEGFCDQSRLGCQIKLTGERDAQVIRHPRSRHVY